jgi:hypothetical protein
MISVNYERKEAQMKLLKRLFCKHEYYANSYIYGDMINVCNGCRTVAKCAKCGKYKSVPELLKVGAKIDK